MDEFPLMISCQQGSPLQLTFLQRYAAIVTRLHVGWQDMQISRPRREQKPPADVHLGESDLGGQAAFV